MLRYQVEGMSCGHCVKAVTAAVLAVAPGAEVAVDLDAGKVSVDGAADAVAVAEAIRAEGYAVATSA